MPRPGRQLSRTTSLSAGQPSHGSVDLAVGGGLAVEARLATAVRSGTDFDQQRSATVSTGSVPAEQKLYGGRLRYDKSSVLHDSHGRIAQEGTYQRFAQQPGTFQRLLPHQVTSEPNGKKHWRCP